MGFIIGRIAKECGVYDEVGSMLNEIEKKYEHNGSATRDNLGLIQNFVAIYSDLTLVFNANDLKVIKDVNSKEIDKEYSDLKEKWEIENIEEHVNNAKAKLENDSTSINELKNSRTDLEDDQRRIDAIELTIEEYVTKKEKLKQEIPDLIAKIDEKIMITIPDFNSMLPSEAEKWGEENKVSITTSTEYSDTIANNKVISQSVKAGEKVIKNDVSIKIVYSKGRKPTTSELNAVKKAQSYSDNLHMSKKGIYKQLVSPYGEGFTASEAQYGIDHVEADWNYNALQKAKSYQENLNMSKNAIYRQLTSSYGEDFTASEAQYAIDHLDD